jgi:hypothetical protein
MVSVSGKTGIVDGGRTSLGGLHMGFTRMDRLSVGGLTASTTYRGVVGSDVSVGVAIVAAWNVFNSADWRELGDSGYHWGVSVGPLRTKLIEQISSLAGGRGKKAYEALEGLLGHAKDVEMLTGIIEDTLGSSAWNGVPGATQVSFDVGMGVFGAEYESEYTSYNFNIGN